jgi:hypothetical protein
MCTDRDQLVCVQFLVGRLVCVQFLVGRQSRNRGNSACSCEAEAVTCGRCHAAVAVSLTGSRMVLSPKSATRSSRPPRAPLGDRDVLLVPPLPVPGLVAAGEQQGRAGGIEREEHPDLGPGRRAGPQLLEVMDPAALDAVHQRPAAIGDVTRDEAGSASGSFSAVQQLAPAIGAAIVTSIYFKVSAAHGGVTAMTVSSFTVAMIIVACLGVVWLLPRTAAEG